MYCFRSRSTRRRAQRDQNFRLGKRTVWISVSVTRVKVAVPVEGNSNRLYHDSGDLFCQGRVNAEQNDATRAAWIGLLERDLTKILIKGEHYPLVTRGKQEYVLVGNSRRMSSNPNDIMMSFLQCVNRKSGKVLVEEDAQSVLMRKAGRLSTLERVGWHKPSKQANLRARDRDNS